MYEHLIIGFLIGLIAHVYYVKAVHRVELEIDLYRSKRQARKSERERSARKQRTKLNTAVNN